MCFLSILYSCIVNLVAKAKRERRREKEGEERVWAREEINDTVIITEHRIALKLFRKSYTNSVV